MPRHWFWHHNIPNHHVDQHWPVSFHLIPGSATGSPFHTTASICSVIRDFVTPCLLFRYTIGEVTHAETPYYWSQSGSCFLKVFPSQWKFHFTLASILVQWSLQNFVHGTTAVLSGHVQKFVAIWWPATELQQNEVSIEFELRAETR